MLAPTVGLNPSLTAHVLVGLVPALVRRAVRERRRRVKPSGLSSELRLCLTYLALLRRPLAFLCSPANILPSVIFRAFHHHQTSSYHFVQVSTLTDTYSWSARDGARSSLKLASPRTFDLMRLSTCTVSPPLLAPHFWFPLFEATRRPLFSLSSPSAVFT